MLHAKLGYGWIRVFMNISISYIIDYKITISDVKLKFTSMIKRNRSLWGLHFISFFIISLILFISI